MSTHAGFLISLYVAEVSVMGSSLHLREAGRDVDARVQPSFHSEGRKVKTSFVSPSNCFLLSFLFYQQGVFGFAGLMPRFIASADVPFFTMIMSAIFTLQPR